MPRILSVEDDADFQHLISLALRNQGWEVHYAFTGPEGHEKALSLDPDLILLDMMLPGLSGLEVIKLLKKNKATRDIPIVVMTAYPAETHFFESELMALGVLEYQRKPIQLGPLVKTIRRLLSSNAHKTAVTAWKRGAVRLVSETKSVWIGEHMVANLPPKRFEVLFHLLQHDGEVPWQELVEKIWGRGGTKNDLEKTVSRLREDLGDEAYRLTTTRDGYQLAV